MAKALFHSELVELSSRGPVTVTVASDIRKSKFPNKPNYVYLKVNGADERAYNFDSPACEAFFSGQKGRTFAVIASGDREGAVVTYVGEAAANMTPPPAQAPPATPPVRPPQAAPPPASPSNPYPPAPVPPPPPAVTHMTSGDALLQTKAFIGRRLSLLKVCVRAVATMQPEWKALMKSEMSEDVFQKFVTTLYISGEAQGLAMRSGFADALPWKIELETLQPAPAKGAPAEKQAPPPTTKPKCADCGAELNEYNQCSNPNCPSLDVPF